MPKSTATAVEVLEAVLNGVDIPWRGNAFRYVALHTGPLAAGDSQSVNEATYSGYARVAVPVGDWTGAGATLTNSEDVTFPARSGFGVETITHFSLGVAESGAGQVLYYEALDDSVIVTNLIRPYFPAGTLAFTES